MAHEKKKTTTAPKAPAAPKADGNPVVTHLMVSAKKAGFRRAGRAWRVEPTEVSVDDFTEAQIEQLLAEPMLTVVPVAKGEEKK
jgi:hypothetical protein